MGRVRVLRGRIVPYSTQGDLQLIQNDQRFTHGYRIKRFVVSYARLHTSTAASRDMYAVLGTHPDALIDPSGAGDVAYWNWADKRQVAWASSDTPGDSYIEQTFELVDPTHVVVRDLWIAMTVNTWSSATDFFNYYIELEEIELSENQAVLAILQEEAQDVN